MKQPKKKYQVYSSYSFMSEFYEDCHQDEWIHEGETWAVSAKQAINNVRHRNYGDKHSQYGAWDVGTYGDYATALTWIAIESDVPLYPEELKEMSIAWSGRQT